MSQRFRVFGTSEAEPQPAALLEHLNGQGALVTGHFHGDDDGWFQADLVGAGGGPLHLERYLAREEGVRDILNTWAGWLETADHSPNHGRLMQHMISTSQLFVLERPGEQVDQSLCIGICRFLAQETAGVYQVDAEGFFSSDGTLLLREFP
jgi:hypothetical protein